MEIRRLPGPLEEQPMADTKMAHSHNASGNTYRSMIFPRTAYFTSIELDNLNVSTPNNQ